MTASAAAYLYRQGIVRRLQCVVCGAEHYGPTADVCPRCERGALPQDYISPLDAVAIIAKNRQTSTIRTNEHE